MKRIQLLMVILTLMVISQLSFGQGQSQRFKMEGINPETITINQTFTADAEIFPFPKNVNKVFGVAVTADIVFNDEGGLVRFLFVDKDYIEHLIYEAYPMLEGTEKLSVKELSEETALLNGLKAYSVKIEITDAQVEIKSLTYTKALGQGVYSEKTVKEKKQEQNEEKIRKINKNLQAKGLNWVAGPTNVSELTYAERKLLYGQSSFPAGFEYYAGGVISAGTSGSLKSATAASPYVDNWDWRNRHGRNWITPVTDQKGCGSCWAFAATGATEAMVNVFFNQLLNLNLSEQDVLSCSGAGDCNGGYPSTALNYITNTGIVDEGTFPYTATDQPCSNKGANPVDKIKIGGRIDFGSTAYPKTEDDLKRMLIQMGPVSGGLYDWSHAMTLVGYKVVKEGDKFYYKSSTVAPGWKTVQSGDPLIGKTVWIFKNSWSKYFGDAGYVYVETSMSNIGWTHAIKTPVLSVVKNYQVICEDKDGDGYYWWGIGPKPSTCNCPDTPDGDDSDPTLGPLDQYGNCIKLISNAPVANFSASKTIITKGETVTFADLSTNSPTSWSWSFAGGTPTTSTSKNPAVTYSTAGTYKVVLTATNSAGSNTKTVENYIQVNEPVLAPVANFSASKTVITKGETVTFTDLSTNTPTSWSWSFAGGTPTTSTSQNPTVTYSTAGTYKVVLTATNSSGSNTKTVENYIQVNEPVLAPVANFSSSKTVITKGETVTFTDLSTNTPTSWTWSFAGGTPSTSTAKNPAVSYATAGTYQVILTATNSAGSNTKTVTNYIQVNEPVSAPVANFSASKTVITKGETVTFTDLSTNTPTSWSWSFAGGTPSSSTLQNPAVTYSTAGTYKVVLTATNSAGSNMKTVENYIQVNEPVLAPAANFSASKTVITRGETVTFTDLSTNSPTSWSWSFAGGTPSSSTLQSPAVTYSTAGTYKVVLTATNSAGSNTKTVENYIQVNEPVLAPAANFSASKTVITKGETVTFTDLSTNTPTTWSWSFAGGTPTTSTSQNPAVTYNTAGTYKVVLTATNSAGSNTKTVENYIQVNEPVSAPVANFSASKTVITKGETVTFTDLSTNTPTSWSWSFSGGTPSTSTLQNPAVTYSTAGTYKVVLTATNSAGSNMKTVENYIQVNEPVLAPVAEFEAVKTSVEIGEQVQFNDQSQNEPTQWEWSFPGGTPAVSTEKNPQVTYNTKGEYDVTLTVSKPGTVGDKKVKLKYIVTIENTPLDYCVPVAISSSPDFISSVAIGNVLNSSTSGSGYSLSGSLVNLSPGKSYSVTLTPKVSTNRNFWKIWIDFNGDFDFSDAGETVVTVSNKKGAAKTSFTVPQYATGTTRMRIAMRNLVAPGECDDNYKGEVEDYPVSFEMAASSGNETAETSALADTDTQDINVSEEIIATAVENVAFGISDGIKCYPNPVNQLLNVQLDMAKPGDFYTIYNINGGKVVSGKIISTLTTIDFGGYSPGIYLLRVVNGGNVFNERIIRK